MRINVKTSNTGDESTDWEHVDHVNDVDVQGGTLRAHRRSHPGCSWHMDSVEYFHVTTIGDED